MEPIIISRTWTQGAPIEPEMLRGCAFTEESGAHQFRISGEDAARNPLTLAGTVLAKMIRADNQTIDVDGSIESGVAVLTLDGDCYHVPGRAKLTIFLSDGTDTIAIYSAVLNIDRATSGQELDSGTTVPSLQQLEAAYEGALTVLGKAVLYAETQTLSAAEKAAAWANLGLTAADDGEGNITFA